MAFVEINPRYQALLERQGLVSASDFLDMPAVVICGHPDRHICHVDLGGGSTTLPAFLKREHCIRWKDRVFNACAGYGMASKSGREAQTLQALVKAGIGCPEWIAVGEDRGGRAFLLLREVPDSMELRSFLNDLKNAAARVRRRFALRLGRALAKFHNAGFDHPDLNAKHVLVNTRNWSIHLLDWQRSRRRQIVPWNQRARDLAALSATVSSALFTDSEKLICLRSYLRACRAKGVLQVPKLMRAAYCISRLENRLLGRRRIREQRQVSPTQKVQRVVWLDGEALCVTPELLDALKGHMPGWLCLASQTENSTATKSESLVSFAETRQGLFVTRQDYRPWRVLWSFICRRRYASPELRQAGILFRLERFGVRVPKLLAFGQRHSFPWRVDSLLLIEHWPRALRLDQWLQRNEAERTESASRLLRHELIQKLAILIRGVHEASCYFAHAESLAESGNISTHAIVIVLGAENGQAVLSLQRVADIVSRRVPSARLAERDLLAICRLFPSVLATRTDRLRLLLGYLGLTRLTPATRKHALRLIHAQPVIKSQIDHSTTATAPDQRRSAA